MKVILADKDNNPGAVVHFPKDTQFMYNTGEFVKIISGVGSPQPYKTLAMFNRSFVIAICDDEISFEPANSMEKK